MQNVGLVKNQFCLKNLTKYMEAIFCAQLKIFILNVLSKSALSTHFKILPLKNNINLKKLMTWYTDKVDTKKARAPCVYISQVEILCFKS